MLRKIYLIMRDFSAQMKKQNISAYAASTAFFLFLSLVPMLIVICTVIPYTPLTEENLVTAFTDFTPQTVDPVVESLIAEVYDKSAGILSIAVFATIWSAAKGVLALIRGLNAINGVEENRSYIFLRMVASLYTIIMLVGVILSLFIMVFGYQLVDLALHRIPQLQYVVTFVMHFRFLFAWGVLTLLFCIIYALIPNRKLRLNEQIPGATFSAVGWSVFSWGFSLYVGSPGSYSIYGSLSIIVIIMIWLYFCMYILLIGAYINRYFQPVSRVLFDRKKEEKKNGASP